MARLARITFSKTHVGTYDYKATIRKPIEN